MVYTVIDIETTGLSREYDDILEFGYIRCDEYTTILGCDTIYFYKPEFRVENPGAQAVHKLTRDFLKQYAGDFNKNLSTLCAVMRGSRVLGKNSNSFDIPFIYNFVSRHANYLERPEVASSQDVQDWYAPVYKEWYKSKYGAATRKKGTLQELIEMIGLSQEDVQRGYAKECKHEDRAVAHSALYDAYMTLLLVRNDLRLPVFRG